MNDRLLERSMLVQDVGVVVGSLLLSYVLRDGLAEVLPALKPAVPPENYAHLLIVFLPTWVWCADRLGLQTVRVVAGSYLDLLRSLLLTQAWGTLALAAILVLAQAPLNRSLIALFLAISTILLLASKLGQRAWVHVVRGEVVALIVGAGDSDLAGELERLRGRSVEWLPSIAAKDLSYRLREGGIDEVVVPGHERHQVLRPLLEVCEQAGIPALVRIDRIDLDLARPRVEIIGPTLFLSYEVHSPDRPALLLKSMLDRAVALLLLVLLFPLIAVLALLVKMDSAGPILFVQKRGGLNGRAFPMLKFRTMRVGAEAERESLLRLNEMDGPVFKVAKDPRVTRVGRFLRRTSLDELPQLINILAGHMSLVGPRPLPLVETVGLTGGHRRRLSVRPGLTCLWQVSGRNDLSFEEWMALDLQYIDRWSLSLDLAILLRTVPALLTGRGAR